MIYDHPLVGLIYRHSPLWAQHALVSAYGLLQLGERLHPAYRRYWAELEASQWHSPEQLGQLQTDRLRALVRHAYENVPYYRRVFDERKLKPADIRVAADLYKLPVLTKQGIRQNYAELRARNIPAARTTEGRTGGTTGAPLRFMLDKERVIFDHTLVGRYWSWAGYQPGDRVAIIFGMDVFAPDISSGAFWRHDWAGNRLYLSSFRLSREILPRYVELLQEWRPKFIASFPSTLFTLARYLESQGQKLPVQGLLTSSEVLTPLECEVIERQFGGRIWDRYSAGERLVSSQQCEFGRHHQNVEFGLLQVDWPLGVPAAPGSKGELVHTGLTNSSMPLIRYASGDLGSLAAGPCPCGRGLPLMSPVDGRNHGVIVTADKRLMPRVGLERVYETLEHVERCQLVQKRLGEVTVRVQPRPGFGEADTAELMRQLRDRLGAGTELRFEMVDELQVSAAGKDCFIVSEVDIDQVSGLSLQLS